MLPEVNIIIVNWNGFEHTHELICSLEKLTYRNFFITVVDNGSAGDDALKLKREFGNRIALIESSINLGFAGGNNLALKEAVEKGYKYILLINNDTIVNPDFLAILIDKISSNIDIGISAPQINYYYEPDIIWSAGGKISRIRSSGFAVTGIHQDKANKKDRYVEFVSGCCMLLKKEVLEKIGFFDENFFLYLEDTDLCLRTSREGYNISLVPSAKIYHKVKTSSGKKSLNPIYYETRNRLYFAKKNFGNYYIISMIYISITMLMKSLLWLLSGKKKKITLVIKAFLDFYHSKFGRAELN